MANSVLKNINYQVGKLCRMGSRKAKLMAISNRRKQQLRHLGERVYIFKALQQDEDIWEKDEISQLLLTIADLDQEQEMIIDEINEIKAESPPEDASVEEESTGPETEAQAEITPEVVVEVIETKVEVPENKVETPETIASPAKTEEKAKPKTPRRRAATKKAAPKKAAPAKAKSDTDNK